MNETPNYYAIIPANVRYDSGLKDKAKLLYGEIVALSNKNGYCYASNSYFAKLYNVSVQTIINMINNLDEKGYITKEVVYKEGSKEILGRYLKIFEGGSQKILTDNNTSINNTSINKKEIYKERFKKPTLEEVEDYCKERNNGINASAFINFYESKGWKVGNTPMKDWKAAVRTWEIKRTTKDVTTKELPTWFSKEQDIKTMSKQEEEQIRREFDDLLKA